MRCIVSFSFLNFCRKSTDLVQGFEKTDGARVVSHLGRGKATFVYTVVDIAGAEKQLNIIEHEKKNFKFILKNENFNFEKIKIFYFKKNHQKIN